ncbi:MAG: hypothetical protein J7539_00080 [Niabella sp.]|nr:hypothetical protein [Niabella sp.]
MDSKLVLNSENELRETIDHQPRGQKIAATLLSYIFHPVFVPVYVIYFLVFVKPFLFVALRLDGPDVVIRAKTGILLQAIVNYTFFPLITVLLLKAVGFIQSIKLKERKDRIIPFIACNIWYFWIWYVWRNLEAVPKELVIFSFAVFMASSVGLLVNIYMKVSMHGIALGTAAAFLCLLGFEYGPGMAVYIAVVLLITGGVATARLLLSDHTAKEVYWGIAVGVAGLLVATVVA